MRFLKVKKKLLFLCFTIVSIGIFAQSEIVGIASPIQLKHGINTINLSDYFVSSTIKSVSSDIGIPLGLSPKKTSITIELNEQLEQALSIITVETEKSSYDILVKRPEKKQIILKLKDNGYQQVQLKGEMNSWNPNLTSVKKIGDEWITEISLNAGNYQYKYIVDGKEINDPSNRDSISNGLGGYNSVLSVAGGNASLTPYLSTKSYDEKHISLSSSVQPTNMYCFCENRIIPKIIKSDEITVAIPEDTKQSSSSLIRCFAEGRGGIGNELFIPLKNGKVVENGLELTRKDSRSQIMYFTLIDRFFNGNTEIDAPVEDKRLHPLTNYMGGDLEGITKKIESGYFDSLHINALWLSPITQNPYTAYQEYIEPQYYYSGYHGYWPISSSKIDFRFGNDESLHRLVDVAHEHDINILLDYVTNHVHEEHPLYKEHPEWATNLYLADSSYNLRLWDQERLTTWFDTFMPSLDFENKEVIDVQVDSTLFWLKKFGLDGYRHDATKHIPKEFWTALTKKLKEEVCEPEGRTIYQIGETYGSRELINSYISSGMLDAQFDFNLYFDAREVFAKDGESFTRLGSSLEESLNYYGHHSSMGNITGNHDQARFVTLASGDVAFHEDQKMAGFNRNIRVTDKIGYKKHRMLIAFVMSIPGVPVIYYGDEIGMAGAGDPDSRRMMRFNNLEQEEALTKSITEKLTKLRREEMPLLYGTTELIEVSDKQMIILRSYFDKKCYIVFNKDAKERNIEINTNEKLRPRIHNSPIQQSDKTNIQIANFSFEIFTNY